MKNTFIHVDCPGPDPLDLESAWISRQMSEPAPKRQTSEQRQIPPSMPILERIPSDDGSDREDNNAEQDKSDSSEIDDFDDLDDASLNRQVSSIKRQISALPDPAAEFD